ncbi:MAG: hypothetical protein K0U69_04720 [Actinomycetia bacterium]|nr:hypothetical protein [Actinomycetes bacterium]
MPKRPVFLISGEGKTPDELKAEARAALARFTQAAEKAGAEATEVADTADPPLSAPGCPGQPPVSRGAGH